jgi:hypothetical protein
VKSASFSINGENGWQVPHEHRGLDSDRTLVLAFGASRGQAEESVKALVAAFPTSKVIGCSTAGEIYGASIVDQSLTVAVARFDSTDLGVARARVSTPADSFAAGADLAQTLLRPNLRAVFVLSEGLHVNGSQMIAGINSVVPQDVVVTGGLAGDGDRFGRTWVLSEGGTHEKIVTAVAMYGAHLEVGHGSNGGWDSFGPLRSVTKSTDNVLYELNGRPALDVYREYLGELASGLPATALLFPLSLRRGAMGKESLVRTILSVDEDRKSMTFAGDIPNGAEVQFMRASFDRLIEGASVAATNSGKDLEGDTLTVAISCVGRRLVLGERAEEEVESAKDNLPKGTTLVGFYSYGELAPQLSGECSLHNQTMTITTFAERPRP